MNVHKNPPIAPCGKPLDCDKSSTRVPSKKVIPFLIVPGGIPNHNTGQNGDEIQLLVWAEVTFCVKIRRVVGRLDTGGLVILRGSLMGRVPFVARVSPTSLFDASP